MFQRKVTVDSRFQFLDIEDTEVCLQGMPAASRRDGPESVSRPEPPAYPLGRPEEKRNLLQSKGRMGIVPLAPP